MRTALLVLFSDVLISSNFLKEHLPFFSSVLNVYLFVSIMPTIPVVDQQT